MNTDRFSLNCRGQLLDLSVPAVMAIINVNQDSFVVESRAQLEDDLVRLADKHLNEGASIIDLGAMSTRPGALEIDKTLEIELISCAVEWIRSRFPEVIISIDTYRSEVAKAALDLGAQMINDIGGGLFDEGMYSVVAKYRAPYILMHNKAKAEFMNQHAQYEDVVEDVLTALFAKVYQAEQKGILDIIIDPGIGFSKTGRQNFILLDRLKELSLIKRPLLVGLSRKTFIYKTNHTTPAEALNGTTAMHSVALQNGANILRVHDVKPAIECIALHQELKKSRAFKH